MGKEREPRPAKLFISLIAREDEVLNQALEKLRGAFGEVDFLSPRFTFDFTDYYAEEMGADLFRHFVTFERLIGMDSLPAVKHETNHLERQLASDGGRRRINIDPGYLCLEHIILATTKSYTHRPYLREGIYADVTLIYGKGSFRALEWTYPDYRQHEIVSLFNRLRERYAEILKGGS